MMLTLRNCTDNEESDIYSKMEEIKKIQCKVCHEDRLFLNERNVCIVCDKGKTEIGTEVDVKRVNRGGGTELASLTGKIDENQWMRGKG